MRNPPETRGISAKGIRKKRGRKEDSTEGRQAAHGFRLPSKSIIPAAFEQVMTQI